MKRQTSISIGCVVFLALVAQAMTARAGADGEDEKPIYQTIPIRYVDAESVALSFGGASLDLLPPDWVTGNLERLRREKRSGSYGDGLVVPDGVESIVAIRQQNALLVYATREAISQLSETIRMLDQPISVVELDLILVVGNPKIIPHEVAFEERDTLAPRSVEEWSAAWRALKRFPSSANWKVCLNTTVRGLNSSCTPASTDLPGEKRWAELDVTPMLEAGGGVHLHTALALRPGHGEIQSVLKAQSGEVVSLRGVRVDEGRELMLFLRPRFATPAATR
ncbi:MAG: hypothetical protein HY318_14765 [Armatimonadetes bacterium]|nr:hypothetical protein [Armatimonadota bacterium]